MRYTVAIDTGNDAFYPDPGPELGRILNALAERIETASQEELKEVIRLRDYNGNTVGEAALVED